MNSKLAFGLSCSLLLLASCVSLPKSFISKNGIYVHEPSGVAFPSSVPDWNLVDHGSTENLTEQIAVAVSYQYRSLTKDFRPYATVYILKNKSGGINLIKARALPTLPEAKLVKSETLKLKSGETVQVEIYNNKASYFEMIGVMGIEKTINAETWFMRPVNNPLLVFWLTINKDETDEVFLPTQFVNDFLERAKAKNDSKKQF